MPRLDLLEQLAAFLDTLPPERFKINEWATGRLDECGTKACAMGWATTLWPNELELVGDNREGWNVRHLSSGEWDGEAVEKFFQISELDAFNLFYPSAKTHRATPQQVAVHIRAFIAEHQGAES